MKSRCITIWEVEFTLTHKPREVESLPGPDTGVKVLCSSLLFPALSKLAIAFEDSLLIWDARNSKVLLDTLLACPKDMSFSSNGQFFTCFSDTTKKVYIWKESTAGYILHQELAFFHIQRLLLSPNGESAVVFLFQRIDLWHTRNPILSSIPTLAYSEFILGFSTNRALAAFVHKGENTVTVLDLQSGNPQLEIDTGLEVKCLGLTGSSIVVGGDEKAVTWNLAAEGYTANINDAIQITIFDCPWSEARSLECMLVSPDLNNVVAFGLGILNLYDVSTGECLDCSTWSQSVLKLLATPDGFKVTDIDVRCYELGRPIFLPRWT